MQISEFISKLAKIRIQHGDIRVVLPQIATNDAEEILFEWNANIDALEIRRDNKLEDLVLAIF